MALKRPASWPQRRKAMTISGALRASLIIAAIMLPAAAQAADKWTTVWAASVQGPYPVGNPSAQPVLKFAFPAPEAGARDQTFRLIAMPEIWGK
jgi:hypothetical protein